MLSHPVTSVCVRLAFINLNVSEPPAAFESFSVCVRFNTLSSSPDDVIAAGVIEVTLLTPSVPAIAVFPLLAATVNLFVATSKFPSTPVAPVTANVPP